MHAGMLAIANGSSPRLRGTGSSTRSPTLSARFIPALAGNRGILFFPRLGLMVHPRACGEQPFLQFQLYRYSGSSPRLRGTAPRLPGDKCQERFIPALAGNSLISECFLICGPVHPRACGEQMCNRFDCVPECGSSPRLRGTGRRRLGNISEIRFIPALAGNSNLRCRGAF